MKRRNDGRYVKSKNINGKRVFFYSSEPTERKALKDIENQMLEYAEKEERGKTFKEVAEEWEAWHNNKVSPSTVRRYNAPYNRVTEAFGETYIKNIRSQEINAFIINFSHKYTSFKTVSMQLSIIKMIFAYAMLNGYIDTDASLYISVPKGLTQTRRTLPDDTDIEKVKSAVNLPFGLFAYTILYTGLRRGEALALQGRDFDFENNCIHINKSCIHDESGRPVVTVPKTAAGDRNTVLLNDLKNVLPKLKPEQYLFGDENNKLPCKTVFERKWQRYLKMAGIEKMTPHQLRHEFATIALEAGIDEKIVQTIIGHTDITTTRNIYQHFTSKGFQNAVDKLNLVVKK